MNNSKRLTEWLDASGNKVGLNNASTSKASANRTNDLFKDRFMKLAKHIEDYYDWSTICYISEWELELEFRTGYEVFNLVVDVNSTIDLTVINAKTHQEIVKTTVGHNEWSKVLSILEARNIISDRKLCESVSLSTIDSFRQYENLWENL